MILQDPVTLIHVTEYLSIISAYNLSVYGLKPAEKSTVRRKSQIEDPKRSSSQHGAGVRQDLEAGLVDIWTAVCQSTAAC